MGFKFVKVILQILPSIRGHYGRYMFDKPGEKYKATEQSTQINNHRGQATFLIA